MIVKKKISSFIDKPDLPEYALRIKDFRKKQGATQANLAFALGVTQGTITQWERGLITPSPMACMAIAKFMAPSGNVDFWYELAGPKYKQMKVVVDSFKSAENKHREEQHAEELGHSLKKIPLLNDAAAAGTPRALDENEINRWISWPKELLPRNGTFTAIRISGDSMDPIILDNHIVIVDTSECDPKNLIGCMVAAREDDGVTIKWLRKDEGHYLLVPQHTSQRHQVRVITKSSSSNWGIVGKVVRWIGEPPKK